MARGSAAEIISRIRARTAPSACHDCAIPSLSSQQLRERIGDLLYRQHIGRRLWQWGGTEAGQVDRDQSGLDTPCIGGGKLRVVQPPIDWEGVEQNHRTSASSCPVAEFKGRTVDHLHQPAGCPRSRSAASLTASMIFR
jgi:hypothetical protein